MMDPFAPLEWDGLTRPAHIIHRVLRKAGQPIVQRRLGHLVQMSDKMVAVAIQQLMKAGIVRYDGTSGSGGRPIGLTCWPPRDQADADKVSDREAA